MMSIHDGHFTCSTRKDVSINVQKTIHPKNIVMIALTMNDMMNPLGGILGNSKKTMSGHKKLQIAK
jgi:hypothetical protein